MGDQITSVPPRAKYRSRTEIIAEILELVKEVTWQTKIMYKCNLSFVQLLEYTKMLLDNNLIKIKEEIHGRQTRRAYLITAKGKALLNSINETAALMPIR